MDFSHLLNSFQSTLGETAPQLLAAVAILVLGWFAALVIRAVVRKGLGVLKLNDRISTSTGSMINVESGIAKVAYYVILLLVFVGVFNALNLTIVSEPLQAFVTQVFAFLPKLIAAGAILLVAWVSAALARTLCTKALATTTFDEKISAEAGVKPVSESLGNVLYWLILLVFIPGVLGALEMKGLLAPVEGMVNKALAILPNVFGAAVLGVVGWFVAKILKDLVANMLAVTGLDGVGRKAGLEGTMSLSRLAGLTVFLFVFIPALIAALNALQIEAVSAPATRMLGIVLDAIPNVFAAAIILGISYVVGVFLSGICAKLLGGIGFDALPQKLGLPAVSQEQAGPSEFAGKVVMFFVMLFAVTEAAGVLGFTQVENLVSMFIQFGGQILLGAVILGVGAWLANFAGRAIHRVGGNNAAAMAGLAKFAILVLVAAMGLRAMGIAGDIVNIAFTLTLGAIAVAVALSFGLGGREAAGRQMEYWLANLRHDEKTSGEAPFSKPEVVNY